MARKRVIAITADSTLSKNQSGSLITLSAVSGATITLPTGSEGLNYEFVVRKEAGAGVYCITAGSNSMDGTMQVVSASGTEGVVFYSTDQTARVASMSSSANGGSLGSSWKIVCDEIGVWRFTGIGILVAGTDATPFGVA